MLCKCWCCVNKDFLTIVNRQKPNKELYNVYNCNVSLIAIIQKDLIEKKVVECPTTTIELQEKKEKNPTHVMCQFFNKFRQNFHHLSPQKR